MTFTRCSVPAAGSLNISNNLLQFENYSAGAFSIPLTANGGTIRLLGNAFSFDSPISALASGVSLDNSTANTLTVAGDGADFTLALGTESWDVHSPAQTSLVDWSGLDVTLSVAAGEEWPDQTEMLLTDDDGPAWLAEPGTTQSYASTAFGDGFATYGSSLGQVREGDYIVDYQTVIFATDDGDVEASPGTPVTLTIDGVSYKATVITAYTTEQAPGTPEYDCMGMPDMLSYELVRVPQVTDWSQLARSAAFDAASIPGCGAD